MAPGKAVLLPRAQRSASVPKSLAHSAILGTFMGSYFQPRVAMLKIIEEMAGTTRLELATSAVTEWQFAVT